MRTDLKLPMAEIPISRLVGWAAAHFSCSILKESICSAVT